MPGGISWEQMAKRDRFIEEAIKAIQAVNARLGYSLTSKETLAHLIQRYIELHKPPRYPGKIKKRVKLTLINGDTDE